MKAQTLIRIALAAVFAIAAAAITVSIVSSEKAYTACEPGIDC